MRWCKIALVPKNESGTIAAWNECNGAFVHNCKTAQMSKYEKAHDLNQQRRCWKNDVRKIAYHRCCRRRAERLGSRSRFAKEFGHLGQTKKQRGNVVSHRQAHK